MFVSTVERHFFTYARISHAFAENTYDWSSGAKIVLKLFCKTKLCDLNINRSGKSRSKIIKVHLKYYSKSDHP